MRTLGWISLVLIGCEDSGSPEPLEPADTGVLTTGTVSTITNPAWPVDWVEFEDEVLRLVNEERALGGVCDTTAFAPSNPLIFDAELTDAARLHSVDMFERQFFAHINPDGTDPFQRIANAGYTGFFPLGENIAAGYYTPAAVVDGWIQSPEHCVNVLNPDFVYLGTGFFFESADPQMYGYYWTQNFGGPK